jgi:enoyl-CoA hydratase
MEYATIRYERKEKVAKITLNRPEKLNAQNKLLLDELEDAMKVADRDPDVRVVVLAGEGPSFSAGHDLEPTDDRPLDWDLERWFLFEEDYFVNKCLAIRNLGKPTIAQVQGYCIGAGLMLAAMCDMIVAAEDARFQNPVARFCAAAVELLVEPWEMGPRKAKEFIFTGDFMDGKEAWRLGLANRVVPAQRLENEVMELAAKVAEVPPVTIALVKRSINHTLDLMGQRKAFEDHFLIHTLAHNTGEWKRFWKQQSAKGGGIKEGGLGTLIKTLWPERGGE